MTDIHNDYVLNPASGRLIKKGSRLYNKLVNEQVLQHQDDSNDTVLVEAETVDEAKEVQKKINKKSLPKNKIVSRRGKKVIKSNRRPTHTELIDNVSELAIESVNENMDYFENNPDMTDEEIQKRIKYLIHQKLISTRTPKKSSPIDIPVKQKKKKGKVRFTVQEPIVDNEDTDEYTDVSDDDDDGSDLE